MKKICFLIGDINHSGGTERVTTLIGNSLARQNNSVSILSLSHGDDPFFELYNVRTYTLFKQKVSMRRNFFQAIKRIRTFLKENQIDTLVVVDSIACVFTIPACVGLKINHICWEHFNMKVNLGSHFRDLGRFMAAKWSTKIVTLTERDKLFWVSKFNMAGTKKIIAIPNPSSFAVQDNLPSLDFKTFLCVGRLTHQKGFDLLLQSWARISFKLKDWKIVIVGTGEDELMLKQMAIDLNIQDSIIFVGQQRNMDSFYRNASFFCMSSRFEGLPMVLLEAQSYGLPIVSFDCDTGPAEVIRSDINGILVKVNDLDEFSLALFNSATISEIDYSKMVKNSFESIRKFELSSIVKKWNDLI